MLDYVALGLGIWAGRTTHKKRYWVIPTVGLLIELPIAIIFAIAFGALEEGSESAGAVLGTLVGGIGIFILIGLFIFSIIYSIVGLVKANKAQPQFTQQPPMAQPPLPQQPMPPAPNFPPPPAPPV